MKMSGEDLIKIVVSYELSESNLDVKIHNSH